MGPCAWTGASDRRWLLSGGAGHGPGGRNPCQNQIAETPSRGNASIRPRLLHAARERFSRWGGQVKRALRRGPRLTDNSMKTSFERKRPWFWEGIVEKFDGRFDVRWSFEDASVCCKRRRSQSS